MAGSYNSKDATWKAVTAVDKTITDDFTTNKANNIKYENTCEEKDGKYRKYPVKPNVSPLEVTISSCM
jgi:hypothetical protein